jgi:hypothetical protein
VLIVKMQEKRASTKQAGGSFVFEGILWRCECCVHCESMLYVLWAAVEALNSQTNKAAKETNTHYYIPAPTRLKTASQNTKSVGPILPGLSWLYSRQPESPAKRSLTSHS